MKLKDAVSKSRNPNTVQIQRLGPLGWKRPVGMRFRELVTNLDLRSTGTEEEDVLETQSTHSPVRLALGSFVLQWLRCHTCLANLLPLSRSAWGPVLLTCLVVLATQTLVKMAQALNSSG